MTNFFLIFSLYQNIKTSFNKNYKMRIEYSTSMSIYVETVQVMSEWERQQSKQHIRTSCLINFLQQIFNTENYRSVWLKLYSFLDALKKLRKETITIVMSVRLYVRLHGIHWTDFHETWHQCFSKICQEK